MEDRYFLVMPAGGLSGEDGSVNASGQRSQ